jgi:hypothetical protein
VTRPARLGSASCASPTAALSSNGPTPIA